MQTKHKNTFTTIHTEGAILPPDLLQRVLVNDITLPGLTPEAYHLGKNEKLNEAINRSWNRLLGVWSGFISATENLLPDDKGVTLTREKWLLILFSELGYGRLSPAKGLEIEGKSYPVSHMWCNTPIHLTGCRIELDRRTTGVAGAARMSPHSMVQEFLNRSKENLWAFVSNGFILRILRDNVSLTRQAYVEFDLAGMMNGQVYSDFALFWLICHQSRVESDNPEDCYLEKWSRTAHQQGTRALEQLRKGVEEAITSLGKGFILYPGNSFLKGKLKEGTLSGQDYYRELLRLVYRLLFLFVAEDRDLLLLPDGKTSEKEIYTKFYSTTKLRALAGKRRGTKHFDLYRGLKLIMDKLNYGGYAELALPALGSYLWSEDAIKDLQQCNISNSDFLDAVRHLSYTVDKNTRRPVDYKNLGSEELGSVYESLLELHPVINTETGEFTLQTAGGSERKTTGSYYTPSSLISCLLDSALDPVLLEACKKVNPESAILNLKICDPACGSGHFLIAAAHRVARKLASVRTGDDEPAPEAVKSAIRDVISNCIYGVDLNPMAVELCKVNLWMEALEPGKPLSFLEHRIKCGNSLVGLDTMERLKEGIPDDAFKAVTGDDKSVASRIKALNKRQRKELQSGQMLMMMDEGEGLKESLGKIAGEMKHVNEIKENSTEDVKKKEEFYGKVRSGPEWWNSWTAANIWTSAFFYQLKDENDPAIATHERLMKFMERPSAVDARLPGTANAMAIRNDFFHWPMEFPVVYEAGGFDVVLGNPPWERIKLQEKEWFEAKKPEVANVANASARKKMIDNLKSKDPMIYELFLEDKRKSEKESLFVRNSGRYPLCGRGDVNTYAIFAELNRNIINSTGRVGCIVPSGIATDDTTKFFFQDVMVKKTLVNLYDFENRDSIFPGVHRSYKFCLLTLTGFKKPILTGSDFVFFAHKTNDIKQSERIINLTVENLKLLNPETWTCPILREKRDYKLLKVIHKKGVMLEQSEWGGYYIRLIHLGDHADAILLEEQLQRGSFNQYKDYISEDNIYLKIYEAKLIWYFDHRYATFQDVINTEVHKGNARNVNKIEYSDPLFTIKPRYWVDANFFYKIIQKYPEKSSWLLAYRDITNATNERTCVVTAIPKTPATVSLPCLGVKDVKNKPLLLANFSSFCFDFAARQKVPGTHLSYGIMKQLPILSSEVYKQVTACYGNIELQNWILPRVLELTYTACDLEPFAIDCGYNGTPFRWNEERRFFIRCELDAAYFHLYGIERDDVDYIMETFPIVKRKDEQKYGEYRTKMVIMGIYDKMKEAMETGKSYETILDPPPVDPKVAHMS